MQRKITSRMISTTTTAFIDEYFFTLNEPTSSEQLTYLSVPPLEPTLANDPPSFFSAVPYVFCVLT